jgi:hypothetical protein
VCNQSKLRSCFAGVNSPAMATSSFLSRLACAKGVDDLIAGFLASPACQDPTLVIAGNGPDAQHLRELAATTPAADRPAAGAPDPDELARAQPGLCALSPYPRCPEPCRRAQRAGTHPMAKSCFCQTETCCLLSLVKGSRFQPPQRSRRVMPASRAIKSSSAGHT